MHRNRNNHLTYFLSPSHAHQTVMFNDGTEYDDYFDQGTVEEVTVTEVDDFFKDTE